MARTAAMPTLDQFQSSVSSFQLRQPGKMMSGRCLKTEERRLLRHTTVRMSSLDAMYRTRSSTSPYGGRQHRTVTPVTSLIAFLEKYSSAKTCSLVKPVMSVNSAPRSVGAHYRRCRSKPTRMRESMSTELRARVEAVNIRAESGASARGGPARVERTRIADRTRQGACHA